jgi:hypothetical protein
MHINLSSNTGDTENNQLHFLGYRLNCFSLSTYEIWKILVSLAILFYIANFHVLGLFIPKNEFGAKKKNPSVTRRCRRFLDEI